MQISDINKFTNTITNAITDANTFTNTITNTISDTNTNTDRITNTSTFLFSFCPRTAVLWCCSLDCINVAAKEELGNYFIEIAEPLRNGGRNSFEKLQENKI